MIWLTLENFKYLSLNDNPIEYKSKYIIEKYKNLDENNFTKISKIIFNSVHYKKTSKRVLDEYFAYQLIENEPSVLLGTICSIIDYRKILCKYCKKYKAKECKGHIKDYCPICYNEYDPKDFEIKMMECGHCRRWIHLKCDKNVTGEIYENMENTLYECNICKKSKIHIKNIQKYKKETLKSCFACKTHLNYEFSDITKIIEIKKYKPSVYGHIGCLIFNKNTKNNIIYSLNTEKCIKCTDIGATVCCVVCGMGPYHLHCAFNILIFSNLPIPSCASHINHHLIDYNINVDGSNLPPHSSLILKTKNILYFNYNWYERIIYINGRKEIIKFKDGYFYINSKKTSIENIIKRYETSNKTLLNDIFKINELEFRIYIKELKNRELKLSHPNKPSNNRFYGDEFLVKENLLEEDCCEECSIYYLANNHTLSRMIAHLKQQNCILKKSSVEGLGLFANTDFIKNEPIIHYLGEKISVEESNRRELIYDKNRCYLFSFEKDYVMDATVEGNLAKYINHSCDPNCYSTLVVSGAWKGVIICAKRDILKGEELSYDYNFTEDTEKIECLCGSINCRKFMN